MNSLIKIGVAGALALGGTVAAHAGIVVPTSSGTTGDVVLYADVFNGSTLVDAYVGDTQISVDSVGGGTKPSTYTDSNLSALLTDAQASGATLEWALEGGSAHGGPAPYMVTTGTTASLGTLNGNTLTTMFNLEVGQINNLNGLLGSATSAQFSADTSPGTTSGNGFNPNLVGPDAHNWYGATGSVVTTGLNTQSELYLLSAAGTGVATPATISGLFDAALTSSGLVFTSLSSGSVPIPGALLLLGSGLMGLAGIARRKSGAISFV